MSYKQVGQSWNAPPGVGQSWNAPASVGGVADYVAENPIRAASGAALAYHGYKRTGSVGWAIAWSLLGALAPIIAVPVALAQGYGKPKGR